jgi:branched-subunit amino acid aminotransferase/4-amino-4-deoxychorismate lyase
MIPPDDRGFTLGDGLFETVLAEKGALADWDAHWTRLLAGCEALGLPAPREAAVQTRAVKALEKAELTKTRAAVRITWTAGSGGRGLDRPEALSPRLVVTAAPAPLPKKPARLITAAARRREALMAGGDEAVMLNLAGRVACAAAANLFWLEGEDLYTPNLNCGILPGTMRARVIAGACASGRKVNEVAAPPEALFRARAIFLTNSLIGVRDVAELDGRPVPQQVGEMFR